MEAARHAAQKTSRAPSHFIGRAQPEVGHGTI
jgi:hypothetical protein